LSVNDLQTIVNKNKKALAFILGVWYSYHMTIQDLAKQDPREIHDQDVRDVQALLAEVLEDDSIPYNTEGQDQND
jgi:uncharacterized metal-binding protein